MTPLKNVNETFKLIENIQTSVLTTHEKNKLIVEFIYRSLQAQNTALYNIAIFNAKNELQIKIIDRSIFLDYCLNELQNL